MQYTRVPYSAKRWRAVNYSTVKYSAVQCSTVQYSAVQYSAVQFSTVQYSDHRPGRGTANPATARQPEGKKEKQCRVQCALDLIL